MAKMVYTEQFVLDKFESALPKTWSMYDHRVSARRLVIVRSSKLLAHIYKVAGRDRFLIKLYDRNQEKKFKELARHMERRGWGVTIEVH